MLDELNFSTPIAFKQKEKGAAAAAMSLLAPSALQVSLILMRWMSPKLWRFLYPVSFFRVVNSACAVGKPLKSLQ